MTLAEAYKKTGPPLHGKKRVAGLKLQATDVDWSTRRRSRGDGTVHVVDPRDGRPHRRARRLRGAGLETLRARASASPDSVASPTRATSSTVFQLRVVALRRELASRRTCC